LEIEEALFGHLRIENRGLTRTETKKLKKEETENTEE